MNCKNLIKKLLEKIPPSLGVSFNKLPFKYRLGELYLDYYKSIDTHLDMPEDNKQRYISAEFEKIKTHFSTYPTFYKEIVDANSSKELRCFPISDKKSLKEIRIEDRSIQQFAFAKYNTGGTSGNPLSFCVEQGFYAREWSHMHYLWSKIGYHPSNTKITIRGKSLNSLYQYNFNQNEFQINSYFNLQREDYHVLLSAFKKYNTSFIHGYPSAIYNFLKRVEKDNPSLLSFLQKNIKGIMFGSEYPAPYYRNYIEELLTANTISWYGHTEGVILAGELYKKYEYVPLLSYGYTEAIEIDGHYHLVGTSFKNIAAPFIRYDTEDLIDPCFSKSGLLKNFRIKEGRIGEFVTDKNGNNISLTGLIFGRHHKLFEHVDFVQVKQPLEGNITIYYSAQDDLQNPDLFFDSSNLNIDIGFVHIKEPYKTPLGKVPLLIK